MADPQHEKNVPLPDKVHAARPRNRYHFDRMEVGDSIFLAEPVRVLYTSRLVQAANNYAKRCPWWEFTADHAEGGVRIWRTA